MSSTSTSTNLVTVGGEVVEKVSNYETNVSKPGHDHKRGKAKTARTAARTPVKRLKDVGPTPERLAKGDVTTASGYRAQDQIERLMKAGKLDHNPRQNMAMFLAAQKLEKLFYDAGLSSGVAAQDLSRVVVHGGEAVGMAQTERQAHCRKEFRLAVKLLGWHEAHPHRGAGRLTVDVVCYGLGVEEAARRHMLPTRTSNLVAIGMDRLREGLFALAAHWRMG